MEHVFAWIQLYRRSTRSQQGTANKHTQKNPCPSFSPSLIFSTKNWVINKWSLRKRSKNTCRRSSLVMHWGNRSYSMRHHKRSGWSKAFKLHQTWGCVYSRFCYVCFKRLNGLPRGSIYISEQKPQSWWMWNVWSSMAMQLLFQVAIIRLDLYFLVMNSWSISCREQ